MDRIDRTEGGYYLEEFAFYKKVLEDTSNEEIKLQCRQAMKALVLSDRYDFTEEWFPFHLVVKTSEDCYIACKDGKFEKQEDCQHFKWEGFRFFVNKKKMVSCHLSGSLVGELSGRITKRTVGKLLVEKAGNKEKFDKILCRTLFKLGTISPAYDLAEEAYQQFRNEQY